MLGMPTRNQSGERALQNASLEESKVYLKNALERLHELTGPDPAQYEQIKGMTYDVRAHQHLKTHSRDCASCCQMTSQMTRLWELPLPGPLETTRALAELTVRTLFCQSRLHGEDAKDWKEGKMTVDRKIPLRRRASEILAGFVPTGLFSICYQPRSDLKDREVEMAPISAKTKTQDSIDYSPKSWIAGQKFLFAVSEPFVKDSFYENGIYEEASTAIDESTVTQRVQTCWKALRDEMEPLGDSTTNHASRLSSPDSRRMVAAVGPLSGWGSQGTTAVPHLNMPLGNTRRSQAEEDEILPAPLKTPR